jgi:hypothetical protein
VTAAIVLLAVEIGFRLGKRVTRRTHAERESPVSAISGAILGLQAFMLAFTFSIVSDRYDTKKTLVREEANVIHTAWHRSDLLQEPDRARTKVLLREYVDKRVDVARATDPDTAEAIMADALRIQNELWDMAVTNARIDMNSDIGALYIESVNQIAEVHASRVNVGLQARVPSGIWIVLYGLLILGMIGVGYQTANADSRRSRATAILAISFSLVVALIAALDHPGNTFISVSQQPMVTLQTEMKSAAVPAAVDQS